MMDEKQLKDLLQREFPAASVTIVLNGNSADICVVSSEFEGLRPVARQQKVYAPLGPLIADGTLHAINIRTEIPGA